MTGWGPDGQALSVSEIEVMTPEAARELYAAIEILCSSPERTAVRLGTSYQLHLGKTNADDYPACVREEFRAILGDLKRLFPTRDKFDGIDEDVAAAMARRVLNAYDRLIGPGERDH